MKQPFVPKSTASNFRQTLIYMLSIIAVALIVISVTLAWFSSEDSGDGNKQFADFDLIYDAKLPTGIIVPDGVYTENCTTNIIGATGTTDAYIRAKVTFTLGEEETTEIIEPLITQVNSATGKRLWLYNDEDGYYYYIGYINDTIGCEFIRGYHALDYSGSTQGAELNVHVKVEAIQREYQAYLDLWPTANEEWKTAISEYDVTKDNEWD